VIELPFVLVSGVRLKKGVLVVVQVNCGQWAVSGLFEAHKFLWFSQ